MSGASTMPQSIDFASACSVSDPVKSDGFVVRWADSESSEEIDGGIIIIITATTAVVTEVIAEFTG